MKIQQVKSLLMLYETQNMTQASEKLYMTQQCLSRQIIALERELGVNLFARKKNGMKPTGLCIQLYPEFQKMADCYDRINNLCYLQGENNSNGIRIVVANGLSSYLDYGTLATTIRNCGILTMTMEEYTTEECISKLLNDDVDMAFLLEPLDDTLLEHIYITQEYGYIAISRTHPLAKETRPIPLSMIDGQNLVRGSDLFAVNKQLERYFSQAGIHPHYIASVSDMTTFINALNEDDLVAILTSNSIPQISNPNIVIREVVEPRFIMKIHCCFKRNSKRAEFLRELMLKIRDSNKNDL